MYTLKLEPSISLRLIKTKRREGVREGATLMGQLPNDKGKAEHSNVLFTLTHTHCRPLGYEHGHILTNLLRYDVNQRLIIVINILILCRYCYIVFNADYWMYMMISPQRSTYIIYITYIIFFILLVLCFHLKNEIYSLKKCLAHTFKDYENQNQYLESFYFIFALKINLPKHIPWLF